MQSLNDDNQRSVNLKEVQWHFEKENVEDPNLPIADVNIMYLPTNQHNIPDALAAKQEELLKLKQFNTYEEVPQKDHETISRTWVEENSLFYVGFRLSKAILALQWSKMNM